MYKKGISQFKRYAFLVPCPTVCHKIIDYTVLCHAIICRAFFARIHSRENLNRNGKVGQQLYRPLVLTDALGNSLASVGLSG